MGHATVVGILSIDHNMLSSPSLFVAAGTQVRSQKVFRDFRN